MSGVVYHRDADAVMSVLPTASIDLAYLDPPFNTKKVQRLKRKRGGSEVSNMSYDDRHVDYDAFLKTSMNRVHRLLKPTGTVYLHLDHRAVYVAKVMMDEVFGPECFLGEIIWSYNYGGRGRRFFAHKHDNILVYARTNGMHVFNYDDVDRIPYKAPEMQYVGRTDEEAKLRIERGQVPTDVWEMSVEGTSSKQRTGYPTQKPLKLLKRIITASSPAGGTVLDPFAGSGTTGAAVAITVKLPTVQRRI